MRKYLSKNIPILSLLVTLAVGGIILPMPGTAEASTALTEYLTSTNTVTTLSTTARQLTNTAPSSSTVVTSKVGKTTGYCELYSRGNTSACSGAGSAPSPSGNGFVWDVTTLEQQQLLSGNWTGAMTLKTSVTSGITVTAYMRAYKYNAGAYTLIAQSVSASKALTSTAAALTFSAGSGALTNLTVGDKLYIDFIVNITANTANSSTATVSLTENGGAAEQMVTPGYQPQPPILTTDAVSPIAQTTATLNGTITAEGANSTIEGFAYGTNSALATVIATTTASGSFGTGAFTHPATGLICNTVYYDRAYATNPTGTGYGSIQSFTTASCVSAPAITTNFAGGINFNSANLVGSITNNGGADATQNGFAYSTNSSTLSSGVSTTTLGGMIGTGSFNGTIGGLSPNLTYYYRAYATNGGGTGYGSILSFVTGDSTPSRMIRLFEGFILKLFSGKIVLFGS